MQTCLKQRRGGDGEESDDEGAAPAANDLYRLGNERKSTLSRTALTHSDSQMSPLH